MTHSRLIDLSMPISNRVITDPPIIKPTIEYTSHSEGAAQMLPFFPGLTVDDLPDGEGWAAETLTPDTIGSTSIDGIDGECAIETSAVPDGSV